MTEPAARRGPDRIAIAGFSLTAFLLVLALLGSQLRAAPVPRPTHPRQVIVRRVVVTTVVERVPAGAHASVPPRHTSVTQAVSAAPVPQPVTTRTSAVR